MAFNGQLQPPDFPIVLPDGRPTDAFGGFLTALKNFLGGGGGTANEFISGIIAGPVVGEYRVIEKIPYGVTLVEFTAKTSAGTLDARLLINGTPVTGSDLSVTTTQDSVTIPDAVAVEADSTLALDLSNLTGAQGLTFTVSYSK